MRILVANKVAPPAPAVPQPVVRWGILGPPDPLRLGPTQDATMRDGSGGGSDDPSKRRRVHLPPLDFDMSDDAVGHVFEGSSLAPGIASETDGKEARRRETVKGKG